MATRRSRIKGIANIPQRRKVEAKPNEDCSVFLKPEPKDKEINSTNDIAESSSTALEEAAVKPETQNDINKAEAKTELPSPSKPSEPIITTNAPSDLPRRRNTIKPTVNKRLFQRPKVNIDNLNQNSDKEEAVNLTNGISESETAATPSNILPIQNLSENDNVNASESPNTHSTINAINLQTETAKSGSDTECPIGPLSPTKIVNRSRIKAVPRLGHRRTSMTVHGSASESEDDGKRSYKRIRTESACSSISTTNEPQVQSDLGSPQKSKEFSTVIQRKCKRTEQSRKMAEARRHFQHKFANQIPDKQKLTMMDLIFYNPINNPMSQKPKKPATEEVVVEEEEAEQEVVAKEETKVEEKNESDEENTVPAPQIKIGPNGEIVIDEKSLIIENVETKRSREEIQKSKIIDGDFDTGYGIYKREKRSKDWSKEETLLFYKALNTLGTDFTLMVELFNGRTRRELKMKFKKEERVNRQLVDKALTQPVQFDITELRKEAEEQQLLQQKKKEEAEKLVRPEIPYIGRFKNKDKPKRKKIPKAPAVPKPPPLYSSLEKGLSAICKSDVEDEGDEINEVEEEVVEEEPEPAKPTRFGRIPKPTKHYTPDELPLVKKKKTTHHIETGQENTLSSLSSLQPGSIMIVASQTPTGEPTFKVFMVTPSQNKVPITLTPDMLSNLTQGQDTENSPNDNRGNDVSSSNGGQTNILTETTSSISDEVTSYEMYPYEQSNISVPTDDNIALPKDENITLCSDGKYDINLSSEHGQSEFILPD